MESIQKMKVQQRTCPLAILPRIAQNGVVSEYYQKYKQALYGSGYLFGQAGISEVFAIMSFRKVYSYKKYPPTLANETSMPLQNRATEASFPPQYQ